MKKLIIAFAVAAFVGVANAATCNWNTATLYTAASAEGGWSSKTIAAAKAEVTMALFVIDSTTYAALSGKSQKDLYEAYKGSTAKATASSLGANPTTGAPIYKGVVQLSDTSADEASMYGVLIATYHDETLNKDFYLATTAQSTYNGATKIGTAAALFSGVANASAGWQAVPEPTSGLLMLLGVAGLALRRKRA